MQLVGIQLDIAWEDRAANHSKVSALLEKSPPARGALVALPEMFSAGFSMSVAAIADDERADERFLCDLARSFECFVIGGVVTRGTDGRGRNEAVVVSPSAAIVARYCKIHPFAPGKEAEHYTAGESIVTFAAGEFSVAPFVCYDLRFPEVFRVATTRGANVLVVIASWPSPRVDHWTTLLKARAIENQAYVLGVNRCGVDPNLPYPGKSVIYDPNGKVLAEAGGGEEVITAEASSAMLTDYRRRLPFLADMRPEFLAVSSPAKSPARR